MNPSLVNSELLNGHNLNYNILSLRFSVIPLIGTTAPGLDEMIENMEDKVQIEYNGREAKLSSAVLVEHIVKKLKNKQIESNREVYLHKYSFGEFKDKTKAVYHLQDNNHSK